MKMKSKLAFSRLIFAMLLFLSFSDRKQKPVIIAYVGGFRGLINTDSIDVARRFAYQLCVRRYKG
jgi:hypothetical protein